jgi:hypothetical protein
VIKSRIEAQDGKTKEYTGAPNVTRIFWGKGWGNVHEILGKPMENRWDMSHFLEVDG